jgi:hypothetical protein
MHSTQGFHHYPQLIADRPSCGNPVLTPFDQALCLVNSAFDLDPLRLDGAVLHQLVEAVASVLEGGWRVASKDH